MFARVRSSNLSANVLKLPWRDAPFFFAVEALFRPIKILPRSVFALGKFAISGDGSECRRRAWCWGCLFLSREQMAALGITAQCLNVA